MACAVCTVHLKTATTTATTTTTAPSNRSLVYFSYSRRRADYTVVCRLQCSCDSQPTKIKWNWKTNAWQSYDRLKQIQQQKPSVRIFIACHFFSFAIFSFHLLPCVFFFSTFMLRAIFVFSSFVSIFGFFRQSILMNTSLWFLCNSKNITDCVYLSRSWKNGLHFLRTGNVELWLSLAPSNTHMISLASLSSLSVFFFGSFCLWYHPFQHIFCFYANILCLLQSIRRFVL